MVDMQGYLVPHWGKTLVPVFRWNVNETVPVYARTAPQRYASGRPAR